MPQAPSTRWCPTPEQLMILEEMYRSGIRTPNASQIQQITAHLSYYGKIEGKNVFYWFQNHKARDRQKMRIRRPSRHHHLLQSQQQSHQINANEQTITTSATHPQFFQMEISQPSAHHQPPRFQFTHQVYNIN